MPISFVRTVLPAVPGLREVDVVEGQDEYTTEVGAMVEVVEEAEGGLQQLRKLVVSATSGAHNSAYWYNTFRSQTIVLFRTTRASLYGKFIPGAIM